MAEVVVPGLDLMIDGASLERPLRIPFCACTRIPGRHHDGLLQTTYRMVSQPGLPGAWVSLSPFEDHGDRNSLQQGYKNRPSPCLVRIRTIQQPPIYTHEKKDSMSVEGLLPQHIRDLISEKPTNLANEVSWLILVCSVQRYR